MRMIAIAFVATFLSIFFAQETFAKTPLTKTEVQEQFIGIPWHGPSGAFLFRKDGTYTYQDFNRSKPSGAWSYRILKDGTLKGHTTSYTFYRRNNGKYLYYHSKSRKNYKAIPNKTAPFRWATSGIRWPFWCLVSVAFHLPLRTTNLRYPRFFSGMERCGTCRRRGSKPTVENQLWLNALEGFLQCFSINT